MFSVRDRRDMGTALLVRHGETTWNRAGRAQGWAPTPLTDRGREQAAAVADHVAEAYDVDRLLSSDLRRAADTAARIGAETGVDPEHDAAWRERDFGRLQGLDYPGLFEAFPRFSLAENGEAAAAERPASGESLLDVRDRVLDAWTSLVADLDPGETALVVCHGGPLHLLTGAVRGVDVATAVLDGTQDNCGLTEVAVGNGEAPRIVRENWTGYR
jgi:probable phosphoglycerate mutase